MVGTTSGGWAGSEPLLPIGPSLPSGTTSPLSPWWIPMASKAGRTRCGAQSWTSLCAEVGGPDDVPPRTMGGSQASRPGVSWLPVTRVVDPRRPRRAALGVDVPIDVWGQGPVRHGQVGGRRHRDQRLTGDRTRSGASSSVGAHWLPHEVSGINVCLEFRGLSVAWTPRMSERRVQDRGFSVPGFRRQD